MWVLPNQWTSLFWNVLSPFPSSSVFPTPFELYLVLLGGVSGVRAPFLSLSLWHVSLPLLNGYDVDVSLFFSRLFCDEPFLSETFAGVV